MVYGLWQSAAGLRTQDYRQSVIANNLANVDTPGFKPDSVSFAERLSEARRLGGAGPRNGLLDVLTGGVVETEPYTSFREGPINPTGGTLDVAIQGEGFLAVKTPDGVRYTRDGRLTKNAAGVLVHAASGGAVLDDQGREITLDNASREKIKIDDRGLIRQGQSDVGRISVVDFDDKRSLKKSGQNLFESDAPARPSTVASVRQGAIEGSAVDPMTTMVDMIAASRAYELNANLISLQDQSLGRAVNDIGRVA